MSLLSLSGTAYVLCVTCQTEIEPLSSDVTQTTLHVVNSLHALDNQ